MSFSFSFTAKSAADVHAAIAELVAKGPYNCPVVVAPMILAAADAIVAKRGTWGDDQAISVVAGGHVCTGTDSDQSSVTITVKPVCVLWTPAPPPVVQAELPLAPAETGAATA